MITENEHAFFQKILIILSIVLFCSFVILLSTVPPVNRDALTHHLVVPKLYLDHGGIYEIPEIEFSYYPQLLELFYLIPLYFKNDIAPSYIHFIFALITSYLIFIYLKNKTTKYVSFLAASFFLALPIIIKLSVTAYVDLGLYFFSFASLFFLILWHRCAHVKYLVFSGFVCGLAMSCKYNGLITFFCMFFSLIWLSSKKSNLSKNVLRSLFLFSFISFFVFSPWLVKNYIWTGNPVYPLYDVFFNHPEKKIQGIDSKIKSHFYYRRVVYEESLAETLTTPVRIFFQGKDDEPKFFDGVLNPFLFFMPFIAMIAEFIRYKKEKILDYERILLFLFSWVYILFVYFQTDMRIRWIGPAIAPLTVLSFLGFNDLWSVSNFNGRKSKHFIRAMLCVFLLVMSFINFKYMCGLYKKIDPFPYLIGAITRDEYIQKNRPEYAAYQYINRNLSENAKVFGLLVGNRRYYCERQMITDENIFRHIVKTAQSVSDIARQLQFNGITHFVVGEEIYNTFFIGSFDENRRQILSDFWTHNTKRLFGGYGYSVYEIII